MLPYLYSIEYASKNKFYVKKNELCKIKNDKSKNMCNESQLYIDYEVIWMVSDIGCLLM